MLEVQIHFHLGEASLHVQGKQGRASFILICDPQAYNFRML